MPSSASVDSLALPTEETSSSPASSSCVSSMAGALSWSCSSAASVGAAMASAGASLVGSTTRSSIACARSEPRLAAGALQSGAGSGTAASAEASALPSDLASASGLACWKTIGDTGVGGGAAGMYMAGVIGVGGGTGPSRAGLALIGLEWTSNLLAALGAGVVPVLARERVTRVFDCTALRGESISS